MVQLGTERSASVVVRNSGTLTIGPIDIGTGPVLNTAGIAVGGASVSTSPSTIPTLGVGASRTLALTLTLPAGVPAGSYGTSVEARLGSKVIASLPLELSVAAGTAGPPIATFSIDSGPISPRQGDVVTYSALALDSAGQALTLSDLSWSVVPSAIGTILPDGRFVGTGSGPATIVASSQSVSATLDINVQARALSAAGFSVVGKGIVHARFTSDLWVHGNVAYTGTWGIRNETGLMGNRLYVWDVSNPAAPVLTDSVMVDARTVNDVKVRAVGTLAVITHEVSNDQLNGVTLLDLTNPLHPAVITRFTAPDLSPGIHNSWIDGNFVYLVVDGVGNGLRVLDVSNPAAPQIVASFYAGSSFLHDVYVRDGLAFLSHWDAGLVILDVGNGIAGGSPSNPMEVSRVQTKSGQTHNAWYWPQAGYVFVGEEDFNFPGTMHVVDVHDLTRPREVASFAVAGATPHNFWLDESRGILYAAWYQTGVHAIDVTGELLGALDRQGREYGVTTYGAPGGCFFSGGTTLDSCTWAPQLQGGVLYLSDLNNGLVALQPNF